MTTHRALLALLVRTCRPWRLGLLCLALANCAQAAADAEVVQVAAGDAHTCALDLEGKVACWGSARYGQLGSNTRESADPVPVDGLSSVVSIAAGYAHTCALKNDGLVACWGWNELGQLGNDSTIDSSTPVAVSGLSDAIAIAAGYGHTCAIRSGGSVACWGNNVFGQLGDATQIERHVPVTVSDLADASALVAGELHTCALKHDGSVVCWGSNHSGQLGVLFSISNSATPIIIGGVAGATALSSNGIRTCSLTGAGPVLCWGGAWGDGYGAPRSIDGLDGATVEVIAVGEAHACVVKHHGAVACWGDNTVGQIGNGSAGEYGGIYPPVTVVGLSKAMSIAAGSGHTCVLKRGGGAPACWGSNSWGQLGNGSLPSRTIPNTISGLSEASAIAAGDRHACALRTNGTVACWGENDAGQLGNGTTNRASTPVMVSGLTNARAIAAGEKHTCALKTDGTAACWGYNFGGQIGNGAEMNGASTGDRDPHPLPSTVVGLTGGVAITADSNTTCVVKQDRTVACWGRAPGRHDYSSVPIAVPVGRLPGASTVTIGLSYACALGTDETTVCWGSNELGQLGNGTTVPSNSPVAVSGLSNVSAIATGRVHTCALKSDGTVACWGGNYLGQLGDGTMDEWPDWFFPGVPHPLPVPVTGLSNASTISSGQNRTCVTRRDGSAACWGANGYGQLGNGTARTTPYPVEVIGLSDARSIAQGIYHSCALRTNGKVACWGLNVNGVLGHGLPNYYTTPQSVRWGDLIFANGFED